MSCDNLDLMSMDEYEYQKCLRIAIMSDEDLKLHCSFHKKGCECIACKELENRKDGK